MNFTKYKNIIRFYSTPTFNRNLNHSNIKKNIIKKIKITNECNAKKIIKYKSYKNMYSGLPIKSTNK